MIPYRIPSSSWVNDFQPRIGLGTFLIVEIPVLTSDMNKINIDNLNLQEKEFKKRIDKGLSILRK
jgi:hypothetical protein